MNSHDASNQHDTSGRQDRARDDLNKPTEGSEPSVGFTRRPLSVTRDLEIMTDAGECIAIVYTDDPATAKADARLISAAPDLLAFAKAAEAWEAMLIAKGRWEATGDGLPTLTDELYDAMMELQSLRNAALSKALGPSVKGEGGLSGADIARTGPVARSETGSAEVGEGG